MQHRHSQASTELIEFENRGHSLTVDHGWREVVSEQLRHTTTQITRDIYLSVMPQVAHAAAEAAAAPVPRGAETPDVNAGAHLRTRETISTATKDPGETVWGGRDSNPRPRDYELDQWGPEG
jgi:hypothetical protein